jgi:hypothetical protein
MAIPLTPGQIEDKTRLIKQGLYWEALDLRQESTTKEVVLRIASLRQSANNDEEFVKLLNIVRRDFASGNYHSVRLQVWEELFPKLNEAVSSSVLGIDEEDISRETVWEKCISENLSRMNGEVIKRIQASLTDRFKAAGVGLGNTAQEQAQSTRLSPQNVAGAIKALKKSIFCLRLAEAYASNRQDIRHNLDIATKLELDYEQTARIRGYHIPDWPEQPSVLVTPPSKKAKPAPEPKPRPAAETPTRTTQLRKPKSKSVAIGLAVAFGLISWLYTYKKDKHKFWISFIITVSILVSSSSVPGWLVLDLALLWVPTTWLWPLVTTAVRPSEFYQEYPRVGVTWLRKPAFVGVVIGSIVLFVLLSALLETTPDSNTGTLGQAVDNPTLTWTTGGNAEWFSQTTTHYYDSDAARSGDVTDNQATWLRAIVTGPGTLTFYWRVSSESTHDFLGFYIDGVEQTGISGFVDWQQKTYSVTSGTHTLEWRYTKDGSGTSISDCGWLDKVEFTSTATPTSLPLLVLEDDFGDTSSGWYVGSTDTYETAYEDGEYSVLVKKSQWCVLVNNWNGGAHSNITAEVDVRDISEVSESCAGIRFRSTLANDAGDSYYVFFIRNSDGAYGIWKCLRNAWTILIDWTTSSYINTGTATNHLKVVCQGGQIEVYANSQKLTTITDLSLVSGYVGVVVETGDQPNAHYHFDNFKLYSFTE